MKLAYVARPCPLCGSTDDSTVVAESTIDESGLDAFAFSSRKLPEHMHHRMIECPVCTLVYASPVPDASSLADAYADAAFDSGVEAQFASRTYAALVRPLLAGMPQPLRALDVGTGDGVFLERLLELGVDDVTGVEPSSAPVAAAAPHVRERIVHDVFGPELFAGKTFSLITCFQTIEHVPDPLVFCRDAAGLLAPGGTLVLVCHDRRSVVNRAMGRRSPIYDIEHVQLFDARSARALLSRPDSAALRCAASATGIRSRTGRGSRLFQALSSGRCSAGSSTVAWAAPRCRSRSGTSSSPERATRASERGTRSRRQQRGRRAATAVPATRAAWLRRPLPEWAWYADYAAGDGMVRRARPATVAGGSARPVHLCGDSVFSFVLGREMLDHGWYFTNSRLGAPAGQQLYDFPIGSDTLNLAMLDGGSRSAATRSSAVNLFFISGFFMSAVAAFWALRRMLISRPASAMAAVLVRDCPVSLPAQRRSPLPIGLLCRPAGRVSRGRTTPGEARHRVPEQAGAARTASALRNHRHRRSLLRGLHARPPSTAALVALTRRERRVVAGAVAAAAVIAGLLVASDVPTLVYDHEHGKAQGVAVRQAFESEFYGQKLAAMVLPMENHRIKALGDLRARYDAADSAHSDVIRAPLGSLPSRRFHRSRVHPAAGCRGCSPAAFRASSAARPGGALGRALHRLDDRRDLETDRLPGHASGACLGTLDDRLRLLRACGRGAAPRRRTAATRRRMAGDAARRGMRRRVVHRGAGSDNERLHLALFAARTRWRADENYVQQVESPFRGAP